MLTRKEIFEFLSSGCLFSGQSGLFLLAWGARENSSQAASGKFSVYTSDFFLGDPTPWRIFSTHRVGTREGLIKCLKTEFFSYSRTESDPRSNPQWVLPEFTDFKETFFDLKARFALNTLKKAVPVVFAQTQMSLDAPKKAKHLLHLLEYTQDLPVSVYGIWGDHEGILGATPELLFRRDAGGEFSTVALAGTRLKENQRQSILPPLLEDSKERAEHQWVIDGILTSLRTVKRLGNVELGKTYELGLPTLTHLCTPIRFQADAFFEDIVRALHPTPALGVFPKVEGHAWLQIQQKKFDRKRFGAPIGWITPNGKSECSVAIRNIQWLDQNVWLGAGCGIIQESDLDREWKEIQGKMSSVKRMLNC